MRFFYFDPTVSTPTGKLSQLAGIDKYIPCFQKRCNLKNIEKYIHLLFWENKRYIYFMYIFKLQRLRERVCVYIYIYIHVHIYIYTTSWRRVHFYQNGFSSVMILVFLVSSMLDYYWDFEEKLCFDNCWGSVGLRFGNVGGHPDSDINTGWNRKITVIGSGTINSHFLRGAVFHFIVTLGTEIFMI